MHADVKEGKPKMAATTLAPRERLDEKLLLKVLTDAGGVEPTLERGCGSRLLYR